MSETVAAAPTAHELLLALAGWVDDDLLATGRELVAVGEEVPALELLVASLAAGRTALPSPVRAALVEAAVGLRVEPHADRVLPPGVPPGETAHRFAAEAGPADVAVRVAGIGTNLPVVARSGARVSLAWRLTPAGAAPGPLPHPVLLAAVQTGGPVEVLAYQLGAALARAGVPASVEAFVDGTALPPYHLAALSEALPLDPAAGEDAPSPAPPATPAAPGHPATAGPGPGLPASGTGAARPGGPGAAGSDLADGVADELLTDRDLPPAPDAPDGGAARSTAGDVVDNGSADGDAAAGGVAATGAAATGVAATGAAATGVAATGAAIGHTVDDASAPEASTPSRGMERPGSGPSGSPSGPAPGAGPFDEGPQGPDLDTPAHPFPATAPRTDDGDRVETYAAADDVPRPGAGTDRAVDGHPAPRPAPRRTASGPESTEWFADPPAGPVGDHGVDPEPVANGVPTPADGWRPVDGVHPVPPTGPIAVPRSDDALDGPLDRPLLDTRLDRPDGPVPQGPVSDEPAPDGAVPDGAVPHGAVADAAGPDGPVVVPGPGAEVRATAGPVADTAYPGEDAWDR
ncbi:hypothetical protein I4I78_28440, partial [Pseudonocardia sp. KRD-291]|nr:hypothetical protein [Pseudonocardia sp. KRD291]